MDTVAMVSKYYSIQEFSLGLSSKSYSTGKGKAQAREASDPDRQQADKDPASWN